MPMEKFVMLTACGFFKQLGLIAQYVFNTVVFIKLHNWPGNNSSELDNRLSSATGYVLAIHIFFRSKICQL